MRKTLIIETKQDHQSGATIEDFAKQKLENVHSDLHLIDTLLQRSRSHYVVCHASDLELAIHKILMEVESTLNIYFGGNYD